MFRRLAPVLALVAPLLSAADAYFPPPDRDGGWRETIPLQPQLAGKRSLPALFLGSRGEPPSRQQFWILVKRYAAAAGIDAAELSPARMRRAA